jgi:hypothetical protein
MSFMDLSTWFKTNYRQSQGQIWVMGIVGIGLLLVTTIAYQIYDSAVLFSSLRSGDQELNACYPNSPDPFIWDFGSVKGFAGQHKLRAFWGSTGLG